MKRPAESASALIDEKIKELGDWRGKTLAKVREIIHEADPEIVEEWKWRGTPTWSHGGIVRTGETYKNVVKMTFARWDALDRTNVVHGTPHNYEWPQLAASRAHQGTTAHVIRPN